MKNFEDPEELKLEFDDEDEINALNKEFKRLESRYNNLLKNFDIVVKDNDRLKDHISLQKSKIESYERELERYRNKDKKRKRKKYIVSDLLELRRKGWSYKKIANYYKVSPSTIHYRINKVIK